MYVYSIELIQFNVSFDNMICFNICVESLRGVGEYWVNVNHVAIVVSDVGTSLAFYTDVVGFQQIMRPDFDR